MGRFVIHEHWATSHHFDLRLEIGGVLRSWAVPKGMPDDPGQNRLAILVEDHALDHLDFEDLTPVPDRPDGTVRKSIWDRGRYSMVRSDDGKLVFDLDGERLHERYALFRTDGTQWLLHLMDG